MLKQEYKDEEMTLKDALKLAVKVLDKTLDITKLTPDKGRSMPALKSYNFEINNLFVLKAVFYFPNKKCWVSYLVVSH